MARDDCFLIDFLGPGSSLSDAGRPLVGENALYYSKAGWLQPLDDYIKDPKLTDAGWDPKDFFTSFTKASTVGGKQIGVVINAETSLLSYRKELFDQFKLE